WDGCCLAVGRHLPGPPRLYESGASADIVTDNLVRKPDCCIFSLWAGCGRCEWGIVCAVSDGGLCGTRHTSLLLEIRSGARGRGIAGQCFRILCGVLNPGDLDGDAASRRISASVGVRARDCDGLFGHSSLHKLCNSRRIAADQRASASLELLLSLGVVCECLPVVAGSG